MEFKNKFLEQGFLGPLEIMSPDDRDYYLRCVVDAERDIDLANSDYRYKSNVLFPWVDQLSRHPGIVALVSDLIGPDFTCPDTIFWIKRPGQGKDVSWHQDATYWNFTNPEHCCVVWYAFNTATPMHGSLKYVPGTHKQQLKHNDIKTPTNLLMRGQTVEYTVKHAQETHVPGGSIMVHHPWIIHGSGPNNTQESRLAVSMIYASTKCRPRINHSPESTVLISGSDIYNHMLHDPRPSENWQDNIPAWKSASDRQHDNYFRLTQRPMGA